MTDGRNRSAVVGGERRVDGIGRIQQRRGAGDVRDVSGRLARKDGIVRHAELLGTLDLTVPVRAFDEANRQAVAVLAAEGDQPLAYRERALLISLHRETWREVLGERRVQVERELEALGFL